MSRTCKVRLVKTLSILALIAGFFIGAYNASASEVFYGPDNLTVGREGEYTTSTIDASAYENIVLQFDFVGEALDRGDVFEYGWRSDTEEVLGIMYGTNEGASATLGDESGNVIVSLPETAQVSSLEVFLRVTANSGVASDYVDISNLTITGDKIELDEDGDGVIEGDYCPGTTIDNAGSDIAKPNRWRFDGSILNQTKNKAGKSSSAVYSMEDTAGCGCDQILTIFQSYTGYLYTGHQKYGCSTGMIEDFVNFLKE